MIHCSCASVHTGTMLARNVGVQNYNFRRPCSINNELQVHSELKIITDDSKAERPVICLFAVLASISEFALLN